MVANATKPEVARMRFKWERTNSAKHSEALAQGVAFTGPSVVHPSGGMGEGQS